MQHEIWVTIPAVYNAGECRFYRQMIGSRGGKRWVRITHGITATGGYQQMFLKSGYYKRTVWSNGWPSKVEFEVLEDGNVRE